uniref:DUF6212 domain-containing protein n=1 Tax=Bosea sp. NBC_00436 TaxID=2969620 RepID=A0A9E8A150_9HYPH
MILQARSSLFPALYSADPKIISVGSPEASASTAATPSAIRWYGCELVEADRYLLTECGEDARDLPPTLCPLEVPPTNVWALWTPDPARERSLLALQAWWARTGGSETPMRVVVGSRADLNAVLLERSLRETDRLQQGNQQLMRDLATLRESWTHHVRIPPEVEELIATLRIGRPHLIFSSPLPSHEIEVPDATKPGAPGAEQALAQRLPCPARGWLGVDLHIADPGRGSGSLHAQVEAADVGTVLARWRVPFDLLSSGWLPLRLPSASSQTSRSLTLRLWADGGEAPPRLSTSPTGLLHEYRFDPQNPAHLAGRDVADMLALKLWGGLPGVRYFATEGDAETLQDPGAVVPIPTPVVAKVALTREQTATYPVFGYMGPGKVLLRPLKTTASAAVISLPATAGLIEVSCEAMIDDKRCRTRRLGARLVVTPRGIGPDEAEAGRDVLAATEWIELNEPLVSSRLLARLPAAQNRPVDLHLFTRLPEPGPIPPHARVVFGRFEAEMHAASAWDMAAVLPVADRETAARFGADRHGALS